MLDLDALPAGVVELEAGDGGIEEARIGLPFRSLYDGDLDAVLRAALALHGAAALRRLTLGSWGPTTSDFSGAMALLSEAELGALEELAIGDWPEEVDGTGGAHVGDVGAVLRAAPRLRRLSVRGGGVTLGELAHDRLERLTLVSAGLGPRVARSLAEARLPALYELSIFFGTDSRSRFEDLAPLFWTTVLPSLESLSLDACPYADECADAIGVAPWAESLSELSFKVGSLSAAGAAALFGAAGRFEALESLDISMSRVPSCWVDDLRAAFGEVLEADSAFQRDGLGADEGYYIYDDIEE